MPWPSESFTDHRYSYFTRNICNQCVDSSKILFGASYEGRSAIVSMEFFLSSQKIAANILIYKDQVQKVSYYSGHCCGTSLNPLYNVMHNSQNWTFATLLCGVIKYRITPPYPSHSSRLSNVTTEQETYNDIKDNQFLVCY